MKLDSYVAGFGCRLARLDVIDRFIDPRYEVIAPEGRRFASGVHFLICIDAADVRSRMVSEPLEPCPEDCPCKETR